MSVKISELSNQEYALLVDVFGSRSRHHLSSSEVERDDSVDQLTLESLIQKNLVTITDSFLGLCVVRNDTGSYWIRPSFRYYFLSYDASAFVYAEIQKQSKEAS